jgi:hypothetical protein
VGFERVPDGMVGPLLREGFSIRAAGLSAALLLSIGLAACGSGDPQDKNEPSGTWKVDVLSASFPGNQHLAENATLRITVKNLDSRAVPDLAVTVDGFDIREDNRDFAQPSRPIWVIEKPPVNSNTAFTNTWSFGSVPAGQTRTLVWKVSAVRAGTYTLRYRVAAGLDGKAKARLPDGTNPEGSFIARVSDKPPPPQID